MLQRAEDSISIGLETNVPRENRYRLLRKRVSYILSRSFPGLPAYPHKTHGLRPIGVGEVLQRIVGKVFMKVFRPDIQSAAGSLQVCVGQSSGCEAKDFAWHW